MDTLTVWTTEHRINRTVTAAAIEGLRKTGTPYVVRQANDYDGNPVPSLSYGVLRGTGRIYQECEKAGVPWWNIDKGFFRPGHYNGYYRIGFRHLQPLFLRERDENVSRWKQLHISILPWVHRPEGIVLVCPPEGICDFYGIDQMSWLKRVIQSLPEDLKDKIVVRLRTSGTPLYYDLFQSRCIVTHSSNVALESLVVGVPAIAETGIVQSWNQMSFSQAGESQEELSRKALFVQAANNQFTLLEFRSGLAWSRTMERFPSV